MQNARATPLPNPTPPGSASCYSWTSHQYGLFDPTNAIRTDTPNCVLDAIALYIKEGDIYDEISSKVSSLHKYDVGVNDVLQFQGLLI